MTIMSDSADSSSEAQRREIEKKLRALDQQLRSEMLARGFDPDQAENLALTAPLAKLVLERENWRARLQALNESELES